MGEVQRLRATGDHVYFELIEKGHGDRVQAKIDVALFRRDRVKVERLLRQHGQELADGQVMRCRGQVDFYPPYGRIQLVARDVDPVFGLGVLEQRRQETLEWLSKRDLLDKNGALAMPAAPMTIGLVTAPDSAAYSDFVTTLQSSGFGFEVVFAPARVQGNQAELSVVRALGRLASWHDDRIRSGGATSDSSGLDCVVVVRGGGSKTDLQAFDSRNVARSVAEFPVPVWTGIGHETDDSIADRVAHTRYKTPTGVAEALVNRVIETDDLRAVLEAQLVQAAQRRLDEAAERLARARAVALGVQHRLERKRGALREVERSLAVAGRVRLKQEGRRIASVVERLPAPVARRLLGAHERRESIARALARAGEHLIERRRLEVSSLARVAEQVSPRRILERGFSLTRDETGRVVKSAQQLEVGARVTTELATGRFLGVVQEVGPVLEDGSDGSGGSDG